MAILCMKPPQQSLKCISGCNCLLPNRFPTEPTKWKPPQEAIYSWRPNLFVPSLPQRGTAAAVTPRSAMARGGRQCRRTLGLELGGSAAWAGTCRTGNGDWRRLTGRARQGGASHLVGWEGGVATRDTSNSGFCSISVGARRTHAHKNSTMLSE